MIGRSFIYRSDNILLTHNNRRRDVGHGEIADADHREIVDSLVVDTRELLEYHGDEVTHLNNAARILLVIDNLVRRREGEYLGNCFSGGVFIFMRCFGR